MCIRDRPNATLCAKAAVEMLLASDKGEDLGQVQESMVREGRIPEAYLISEGRLGEVTNLPSVKEQDEVVSMGYDGSGKWCVQGKF